jgi:hypothetical protein
MIITTGRPLPAPLAEDATVATQPAGNCSICKHPIITCERYASTVPTGQLAHLRCIALAATATRTRVPVIW